MHKIFLTAKPYIMKDQFVPYKYAKMMKKLGFDEETIHYSINKNKKKIFSYLPVRKWNTSSFYMENERIFPNIALPLYQQAEEWLWDKYNIQISEKEDLMANAGYYSVIKEVGISKSESNFHLSPVTAHREGILKAIEYLHKQIKK